MHRFSLSLVVSISILLSLLVISVSYDYAYPEVVTPEPVAAMPEDIPAYPSKAEPPVIPPAPECAFFGVEQFEDGLGGVEPNVFRFDADNEEQPFSCIAQRITETKNNCAKGNYNTTAPIFLDDCYVREFAGSIFELKRRICPQNLSFCMGHNLCADGVNQGNCWSKPREYFTVDVGAQSNGAYCDSMRSGEPIFECPHFVRTEWWGIADENTGWHWGCSLCGNGHWYFDRNCDVVPEPSDESLICGRMEVHFKFSTPISLIWTPGLDIEEDAVLVKFALNPASPEQWTVWKASADAPLLVFDPTHQGRITSAAQLFGSWAFGGQPHAALDNCRAPMAGAVPWENGYQALATLDQNGDGKLAGAELASLGLWFDANRDGISQQGEVRALADTDVETLFCSPDGRDEKTGAVYAAVGFERRENGAVVRGKSIDWLGAGAKSQFELLAQHGWPLYALSSGREDRAVLPPPTASENPAAETAKNPQAGPAVVTGLWSWRFDGAGTRKAPNGYFLFYTGMDTTKVVGYSLLEAQFSEAPRPDLRSRVSAVLVDGSLFPAADGASALAFNADVPGARVENRAIVSADGLRMDGTSQVKSAANGGVITYRWSAKKER